jgi:uncharacterized protein (DUF1697 family)
MQMTIYVSLFRSINVGGRTVRMNELKDLYESLGFKDVITYIQSGNVICTDHDADEAQLTKQIEDSFAQKFGFHAKVIVRTPAELQETIANNPFQNQPTKESNRIAVLFLAIRPESSALEDLRKSYLGPEEFYLIGQELYIYYPEGQGRSKLTLTLIERKLKTTGTVRNWNTVLQLHKLTQR